MGETTNIQWTDSTFSPWMGCTKVSPACAHCYAERDTKRWGKALWGDDAPRQVTSDANWKKPIQWNKKAEQEGVRKKVFCSSLADVFEDRRDLDEPRERLWKLIEDTPHLDWQLLTKRPENMISFTPAGWKNAWPTNVWAGTTAENQEWANKRIDALTMVPAKIRFLSCEPLLGPISLGRWFDWAEVIGLKPDAKNGDLLADSIETRRNLDWLIVGGESGSGFREMKDEWVRSLFEQARKAGIAFFFKQGFGIHPDKEPLIDGVRYTEFPK